MTESRRTITLVLHPEVDDKFRRAVAEKLGTKHGILGEAIQKALEYYAEGLLRGTIKPFEYKRERRSKAYASGEGTSARSENKAQATKSKVVQRDLGSEKKESLFDASKNEPKIPTPNKPNVPEELNPFRKYDSMSYEELSYAAQNIGDISTQEKVKEFEYICDRMVALIEKSKSL